MNACSFCDRDCSSLFSCINYSLGRGGMLAGFEVEDTQIQEGQVTYPKSHSQTVDSGFKPKQPDSRASSQYTTSCTSCYNLDL